MIHASAVAWAGCAAVLLGPSGSGKSALALELMARGARLVGDDRLIVTPRADGCEVAPVPALAGLIEARGLGLLRARHQGRARAAVVVDLARPETERLPPSRIHDLAGCHLPLLLRVDAPYFAAAILQFLKAGRLTP